MPNTYQLDRTNPQSADIEKDIAVSVLAVIPDGYLSDEETARLEPKMDMVNNVARRLVAAMIKGTVKYAHDAWSVDEWIDYGYDDASDTLLYLELAKDRRRKDRQQEEGD